MREQRVVGDRDLPGGEAVGLELPAHQVASRDLDLLLFGVAGQLDDLHAVAQRPGDGVELVGGGDEQHLRQVEGHAEVVVAERAVLLGVEHLEQRRRGSPWNPWPSLSISSSMKTGLRVPALRERLDDAARQRADVGAAVAADLGLVVHAAQADAHELAAQRAGDALAERRLAHARRADEAQDRAAALRVELAHRQVLEDALLDLLEAVVVVVEDAARPLDVDGLRVELRPGQRDQPVEVGAHHRVLAARLGHPLEALQLLARVLLDLRRHAGLRDGFAELGHLAALALVAQLLLDLAHLLAQQDLALAVVDLLLGLLLDLARQLQHLDPAGEVVRDGLEPVADVGDLQHRLLLRRAHVQEARDHVGERRGRLHGLDGVGQFRRRLGQQRDGLDRLLLQVAGSAPRPPGGGRRSRAGTRRAPPGTGTRRRGPARGSAARPGRPGGGCRRGP